MRTSRLGLGTASLHHLFGTRSRQALLDHAWDLGIRYFDTAPLYGHEMAEREVGYFARRRREQVLIATKFGILPDPRLARHPSLLYARLAAGAALRRFLPAARLGGEPARDYSPAYARQRLERSLSILGTDYVDILFLHEPSLRMIMDLQGLAMELGRLKAAGKVRQVGLSGPRLQCAALARRCPAIAEVLQVEVGSSNNAASIQTACRQPQVTFGHFRGTPLGKARSPEHRAAQLDACMARAISTNPEGVILFSTRRSAHLDDLCAALKRIESGL
ncbi:MAG: aldo/keto reductase [Candidatus Parcubacteria bacterium]|nr:aldo/keto reductase [Burkholderiales bacterium]